MNFRTFPALSIGASFCMGVALIGCGGSGPSSTGTVNLSSGLIHEWKFNGNANDSIGNLTATTVGAVSYGPGVIGQGIVMDGQTMGVTLPPVQDMQFQGSFTLSAWVAIYAYPSTSKGASQIIFDGDDRPGLDPYYISIDPYGTLQFEVCGAADSSQGLQEFGGYLPLNTFALVTATYDQPSGTMRLYENGKLVSEVLGKTEQTPVVALDPTANPGIGIGTNNDFPVSSYNYGWDGMINDMRVYARALTTGEVQALYNQGAATANAAVRH